MGEARRKMERGQYPVRTAKKRPEARFSARASGRALIAALHAMRGKTDGDDEKRAKWTAKQVRRARVRRAMAKASRKRNRR